MREKTLEYMSLTLAPFDKAIESYVGDFRRQFQSGFGEELPPDAAEALGLIQSTLESRKSEIEDQVVAIFESKFTEADLDALLTWQRSEVARKNAEVSQEISKKTIECVNEWFSTCLKSIEPRLGELLGSASVAAPPAAPSP